MEKVSYLGLPNCYRLSNGTVDLIVATDIGPRVLFYGLRGGENVFGEVPGAVVTTSLGDWKPWGGHRLWAAPEVNPRSYAPDNDPVDFDFDGETSVRLPHRALVAPARLRRRRDRRLARRSARPAATTNRSSRLRV